MINKLVPQKCAVIIGTFNPDSKTWQHRYHAQDIAPANVSRGHCEIKKMAVGFPGRTPGMYPRISSGHPRFGLLELRRNPEITEKKIIAGERRNAASR